MFWIHFFLKVTQKITAQSMKTLSLTRLDTAILDQKEYTTAINNAFKTISKYELLKAENCFSPPRHESRGDVILRHPS